MSNMSDQQYLLHHQYNKSDNLNARIQLHEKFSTNPQNWHRWVFDHLQIPTGSRVLELGTGTGQLWLQNLDRIPTNWTITISDFSPAMLADAKQHLAEQASHFQFATIDAQAIPFEKNSFDYVIANHMLYHVPDRAHAFAEIRRILSSNGRLYATTNGEGHLSEIKQLCEQAGIEYWGTLSSLSTSNFNLNNGAEQMYPWFPTVEVIQMENSLVITEAEPLVAFILSTSSPDKTAESTIQSLRTLIKQELAKHGAIHISKETGLFIAA